MSMPLKKSLPSNFRKLSITQRQHIFRDIFALTEDECSLLSNAWDLSELSDILIESSIGTFPVPFGVATGFCIDGEQMAIPMATEEASVIAAASLMARIVSGGGGFKTWADESITSAQIFIEKTKENAAEQILAASEEIGKQIDEDLIPKMKERGGGFRGLDISPISQGICVTIDIDVCDAMGANSVNTVAEGLKRKMIQLSAGEVLMAILTNHAEKRKAGASFSVPERFLKGEEVCRKIIRATEVANECPERAVTHNKGIMNGISALALATGNDTRAIEAGAHFYAQRGGKYRSLTSFELSDGMLKGSIELPLTLGSVGGAVNIWPASQLSLKILKNPNAQRLNRIAAALGLAQNLAALFALVTEGIQEGHMKLHAARFQRGEKP